jgi:hypothetical protein
MIVMTDDIDLHRAARVVHSIWQAFGSNMSQFVTRLAGGGKIDLLGVGTQ